MNHTVAVNFFKAVLDHPDKNVGDLLFEYLFVRCKKNQAKINKLKLYPIDESLIREKFSNYYIADLPDDFQSLGIAEDYGERAWRFEDKNRESVIAWDMGNSYYWILGKE